MENRQNSSSGIISEAPVPAPWVRELKSTGEPLFTCGVQAGPGRNFLVGVGVVFCLLGGWGLYWLLTGERPQTFEGYFSFLLPAGVVLCGFFCFDAALFARSRYQIGGDALTAQKVSLFRRQRAVIPRKSVVALWQKYSPPDPTAPSSTPGDWVTYLVLDTDEGGDGVAEVPLDGVHSAEEAVWLAGLLGRWAGVPVERSFAPDVNQASAGPLPQLPPVED